jgi:Sigma-70 region 2
LSWADASVPEPSVAGSPLECSTIAPTANATVDRTIRLTSSLRIPRVTASKPSRPVRRGSLLGSPSQGNTANIHGSAWGCSCIHGSCEQRERSCSSPRNASRHGPASTRSSSFEEEHERLFKALYFVTGNRYDAEELMQDAFVSLWERWDEIGRIEDPTGYLFRVALNGFRMRRRRAAMAVRKVVPIPERRDAFLDAGMRADVRQLLLEVSPRPLARGPARVPVRAGGAHPAGASVHGEALASKGRQALRAMEGARDA